MLYRVSLSLVSTKTGMADGRGRAAGVAQSEQELPTLVGVLATDADAAREGADATALQALTAALRAAGRGKIALFGAEGTAQMLDAAGLKAADVLRDPRPAKGLQGLDLLAVGTVTAFPR
jgi:hypothetical protein